MEIPSGLLVAAFDEITARFVVIGQKISFADPRTAKAAGCIVASPPAPVAGAITVSPHVEFIVPRRHRVICRIAGTQHQPPSIQKPEPDAPRKRSRSRRR